MSDPKSYPEYQEPFHPDEVDGVDEGLRELNENDASAEERDESAEEAEVDPEGSAAR